MTTAATIASRLILDAKSFNDAIAGAEKKASGFASNMKQLGKKMAVVGGAMTAGITTPILGMASMSISAASDLSESMNKVDVVFANNGASIIKWSEDSASAFGMSQQKALEAAGTYGNLFQAMGAGEDDATAMSKGLVGLAADLASFNNANPDDVLLALRSGLSGEAEPMKRFGVALNEAAVKSRALEMGLGDLEGNFTEGEKMAARYSLIMEQTSMAQGDFARTSEGLANSQRIVAAQWEDIKAQLGTYLLPYVEQFAGWVKQLADKFMMLNPEQKKTIVIIAGIAAAIGPLLVVVGTLISSIGAIAGVFTAISAPVLIVVAVLIAVVALLALAWKNNWGGIQEKTAAVVAWITTNVQLFLANIQAWWAAHKDQVMATVQALWDGLVSIFNWFKGIFAGLMSAFRSAREGDWTAFGTKLREVWDEVWAKIIELLSKAWETIKTVIGDLITSVIKKFKETDWKEVGTNIIKGVAKGISSAGKWIIDAAKNAAKAAFDAAMAFFKMGSPSKLMRDEVGRNIVRGMAVGIDDEADTPVKAIDRMNAGVMRSVNGAINNGSGTGRSVTITNLNVYTNGGADAVPFGIERALATT